MALDSSLPVVLASPPPDAAAPAGPARAGVATTATATSTPPPAGDPVIGRPVRHAVLSRAPAEAVPARSAFRCGVCGYGAYFRGPVARDCPMCRHYAWVTAVAGRGDPGVL